MGSTTLLHAWQNWISGQRLDPNILLWHLPLFAWVRLAKIARFAGALTILIEVIGVERMRSYARILRSFQMKQIFRLWAIARQSTLPELRAAIKLMKEGRSVRLVRNSNDQESYIALTMLTGLMGWFIYAFCGWIGWLPSGIASWLASDISGLMLVLLVFVVIVSPVILFLLCLATAFVAWILRYALARPMAYVLGHPKINWIAKVFASVCLIVGFHFELLGS